MRGRVDFAPIQGRCRYPVGTAFYFVVGLDPSPRFHGRPIATDSALVNPFAKPPPGLLRALEAGARLNAAQLLCFARQSRSLYVPNLNPKGNFE